VWTVFEPGAEDHSFHRLDVMQVGAREMGAGVAWTAAVERRGVVAVAGRCGS